MSTVAPGRLPPPALAESSARARAVTVGLRRMWSGNGRREKRETAKKNQIAQEERNRITTQHFANRVYRDLGHGMNGQTHLFICFFVSLFVSWSVDPLDSRLTRGICFRGRRTMYYYAQVSPGTPLVAWRPRRSGNLLCNVRSEKSGGARVGATAVRARVKMKRKRQN